MGNLATAVRGVAQPGVASASMAVTEGQPAPSFELPDQNNATVRLEDLRGTWVVLWWYPKASTPG